MYAEVPPWSADLTKNINYVFWYKIFNLFSLSVLRKRNTNYCFAN